MLADHLQSSRQQPPSLWTMLGVQEPPSGSLLGNSRIQTVVVGIKEGGFGSSSSRLRRRIAQGRAVHDDRASRELRWLSENHQRYAGRWVALRGNQLIAVGDTARDVFAAVADEEEAPLVTRISEDEDAPFAGW